ncbi:MAG TPA: hypothetical protein VLT33_17420 [Labilithrix sp.]|nr:hypothetical protein [Labilithrix sp.]
MPSSNRLFTSLVLVLATSSAVACGSSARSNDDPSVPSPSRDDAGNGGGDAATTPKADPVNDTPAPSEINETLGVFVAPSGAANGDGSRARPLATVQAGVDLGKSVGKRVYVCTGTYHEAVTLADSISVIGGMDCSAATWTVGGARSRIEAPSSPAVRAKDITSPTRIEGLDIVAPSATEPGASSIGMLADHSAGLTLAKSSVKAGDGASGADGTEGIALTLDAVAAKGEDTVPDGKCVTGVTCSGVAAGGAIDWKSSRGGVGGTSLCSGAPGHNGQSGGAGGGGGLFVRSAPSPVLPRPPAVWEYYTGRFLSPVSKPSFGEDRSRLPAPGGASGVSGASLGTLGVDGYAGVAGGAGTDGSPGYGGFGGRGSNPTTPADNAAVSDTWRGLGGPAGGAGGCPGLAGTPGGGGGASIALALIDSPMVVDGTQLTAGKGGAGGHGTFGSDPTAGGAAGAELSGDPNNAARGGGRGGAPGISANGSSGPSIGILHSGAPAKLQAGGRATAGTGGAAIAERSHDDAGNVRTIPATPAGLAKDVLAL